MEDDKDKKMSDRDRKMAWSFEGFGSKEKDDDKDKKKGKRTVKIPRKGMIAGSGETQEAKPDSEKKGLLSGLLGEKEVKVESVSEHTKEKAEPSKDDYQEVVFDRIKDVEQELELPLHEDDADVIATDAEFLEEVSERIEEGLPPETAIDDALETVYIPPEADATETDLEDRINYEPVETGEINEISEIVTEVGDATEDTLPEILEVDEPQTIEVAPEPETVPMNEIYYRERSSGNVIMGGAMGYLLRNRHGRGAEHQEVNKPRHDKQAEKQPERKLEEFRNKLESTEAVVREVAINQAAERPRVEMKDDKPGPSEKSAEEQLAKLKIETLSQEKRDIEKQEKQFENVLDKELEQAKIVDKPETHSDKVPEVFRDLLERGRDVRSLTMPELLEVAEHISFEKSTLKELYEHHRIDAVNMRRVIIEYMNGGTRYERLLVKSLEAVEMQRELRNEIKQDDDINYFGLTDESGRDKEGVNQNNNQDAVTQISASLKNDIESDKQSDVETIEKYSVITKEWAVTIGILTGIAIAVLAIVFG